MKDIINNMQKGLSEYSPGANTAVESATNGNRGIDYSDTLLFGNGFLV